MKPLAGLPPDALRRAMALWDALQDAPSAEAEALWARADKDDAAVAAAVRAMQVADLAGETLGQAPAPGATTASADASLPDTLGPYRVLSLLGSGGMSHVYAAIRMQGPQRVVALKVLRPELLSSALKDRFLREQALQERLAHPHIAQLYDAGLDVACGPYLAMERIDGLPITQHAQTLGLSVSARIRLFLQACDAVTYAHANLIVHRDLKPSNILVDGRGQVKLLDFGIAKWLSGEAAQGDATELTHLGGQAFTPDYAAPEQVLGGRVTTATDVYALGVLLFELLTGQRPFGAGEATASKAAQRVPARASSKAADPAQARALRGDLDAIVAKALAPVPADRYASVPALADDLGRYLARRPIAARQAPWADRAVKFVRRNPAAVALTVAVMLAVSGGVGATLWQAGQTAAQAARADAVRGFLISLFRSVTPEVSQDELPTARDLALEGERRLADERSLPLSAKAELAGVLAEVWARSGEPQRSVPLLRQQIGWLTTLHGAGSEEVVRAHVALGDALMASDQLDAAEQTWRAVVPDARRHFESGGSTYVSLMTQLGTLKTNRGDTDGGLADRLALLAQVQANPRVPAIARAELFNDLGAAYFMAGRYQESADSLQRAIDHDRRHPQGDQARDVREQLNTRSNLTFALWAQGRLAHARDESAVLRADVIARLGERHVLALNQARLTVMIDTELGLYDEALELIEQTLPLVDRDKPEWGKWHVALLADRAFVLTHRGRWREGGALAQEQLRYFLAEPRPEAYGADLASMAAMDALIAQGRFAQAAALGEQLLQAFQGNWRPVRQLQLRLRRAVVEQDPERLAAQLAQLQQEARSLAPDEPLAGKLCSVLAIRGQPAGGPRKAALDACGAKLQSLPAAHPARAAWQRFSDHPQRQPAASDWLDLLA
jgi:eukaryotic-like serine/threonine-protein kinase